MSSGRTIQTSSPSVHATIDNAAHGDRRRRNTDWQQPSTPGMEMGWSSNGLVRRHEPSSSRTISRGLEFTGLGFTLLLPNAKFDNDLQHIPGPKESTIIQVAGDKVLNSPRVVVLSSSSHHASPSLPTHFLNSRQARQSLEPRLNFSFDSASIWIALYFTFNLSLTLHNKAVLVDFPFPYVLTAVHSLCSSLGVLVVRHRGLYTPSKLAAKDIWSLLAFSALYALNVAISNVSLGMVSVPVGVTVTSKNRGNLLGCEVSSSCTIIDTFLRPGTVILATGIHLQPLQTIFSPPRHLRCNSCVCHPPRASSYELLTICIELLATTLILFPASS
jgi:hypothetical protein